MAIQPLRRFFPLVPGQPAACQSLASFMLLALIVIGLPALSGAQQNCRPDGDVDQNGGVTAADALLAFQQALSLTQLNACQRSIADVFPQPAAPDGDITASDALCIFQKALSLPSCLDGASLPNQPPVADAGPDQTVDENTLVTLSGSATDPDGTIMVINWLQTSGTEVLLFSAETANPYFTAPQVDANEVLVFELTVADDEYEFDRDTVTITVMDTGSQAPLTANAGPDRTVDENTRVALSGADSQGTITSYEWIQTGGTPVLLHDAHTPNPYFTAPQVDGEEDLVFQLSVIESVFAWDTDTVTITVRDAPAPSGLREMVFQNPRPGQPSYVIAGDNAGLQYWMDASGTVSQALYEKADGTERVRIFYDEQTEAPRTVHNETSGHWLSVREAGPDRVDLWAYDGAGNYLGGFAVYEKSGQYYTGEVVGVPAHEWDRVTGELTSSDGSWTGTFTLMGDPDDGLTNIRLAPPELAALIDGLSASGPVVASADFANQAQGTPSSKHKALTQAGLIAIGVGVTAGAYAGVGVVGSVAVAGTVAVLAAQMVPVIADGIRRTFGRDCPPQDTFFGRICAELTNMAADRLARPGAGPTGYARDALDWVKDTPSRLRDRATNVVNVVSGLLSGDSVGMRTDSEPVSLIAPPTVDGYVTGSGSGPDGASGPLEGPFNRDRTFSVMGTDNQGQQVSIRGSAGDDGTPTGTGNWGPHSFTASGSGTPRPPIAIQIPDQTLTVGQAFTLDLSSYFSHPDGLALTYEVTCRTITANTSPQVTLGQSGQVTLLADTVGSSSCTARAYPLQASWQRVFSVFLAQVAPATETEGPSNGQQPGVDPNNGIFISGTAITHTGPAGLVAQGHQILEIAPAPSRAGLRLGDNERRNSNNQLHGLQIFLYSDGSMSVNHYENGVQTARGGYNSAGTAVGDFYRRANGELDGVQYFLYSNGSWSFNTYSAGTRHGPSGYYNEEGTPVGDFSTYVDGKWEGVQYFLYSDGSWSFNTYSAGTRHGPSGYYTSSGQKNGLFGNYANGQQCGTWTFHFMDGSTSTTQHQGC